MLMDAIRGYIQIASGLTDATSEKAKEVAQSLLSVAGIANPSEVTSQVSGMADEVLSTAKAQRANLIALIRAEVSTVVDSSGLAKAADLDSLKSTISRLAAEVEQLVREVPTAGAHARDEAARFVEEHTPASLGAASMRARVRPTKKAAAAKKTSASSAGTRKSTAKKSATKKATSGTTTRKSTPRKSTAKKTATPATPASETTPTQAE